MVTSRDEPFSPADRAGVEDSINDYLALAGVPPRPAGFTWFLRLPDGWPADRDFCEDFDALVLAGPAPARGSGMPKEWLVAMGAAVQVLHP